jgi:peptidoglycan hydrolase-like protein with peptidoglycan-binding domain
VNEPIRPRPHRRASHPDRRARRSRSVPALVAVVLGLALGPVGSGLIPAWTPTAGAVGPTVPKRPPPTAQPSPTTRPAASPTTRPGPAAGSDRPSMAGRPGSGSGGNSTPSRGLGIGAKGAAVARLQQLLIDNRYDVSAPDGNYGGQTYHAVMAVQKAWGLPRTGRANQAVLDVLEQGTEPDPIVPAGGATRIEIDLPRQVLLLYVDGSLRSILSISSGNGERFCDPDPEQGGKIVCDVARTPGGSFRVYNRILGFRESRLGALYNPLYFNGGIAVHGSRSVPATPASHGCIRVTMASAEWLFDLVPNGTPVYVYDGERVPRPLAERPATSVPATSVPASTTSTVPASTSSSVPASTTSTVPASTSSTVPASTSSTSTTAPGPGDTAPSSMPTSTTVPPTLPGN